MRRSVRRSVNQISQSGFSLSVDHTIDQSICQSTNEVRNQVTNQSVGQLLRKSVRKSVDPPDRCTVEPLQVWWREENWYLARFSLTQKMQKLVRPLIYLVVGYGIGGPRLLSLKDHEIKVCLDLPARSLSLSLRAEGEGALRLPMVRMTISSRRRANGSNSCSSFAC